MSKTTVLIISPDDGMEGFIKGLLFSNWEEQYDIIQIDQINDNIPPSNICLLDEGALPDNGIDHLANSSFQIAPRPLIYIMSEEPDNATAYKTVKSFTADYLVKSRMSSAGLHNSIRYALENTELKLEIEQQQKRYSSLFYNAVEPAFFLNKDLSITSINDSFLKTFSLDSSEIINQKFISFLVDNPKKNDLEIKLASSSNFGIEGEYQFNPGPHTSEFLGHLRISPIIDTVLENGEFKSHIIAYHGTLRNVSHHERLRDVKEKSEKIAMTYRLARTMAHEIRNPLTNVNLAIDQLKDETKDNESLNLYYGIIERCTKRIDDILGQLLSSSEKQVFKKTHFDVVALFKTVVDSIKDRSQLEGVNIEMHYKIDHAPFIGDKEKLRIAFTNLFTNAIESMDKNEKTIVCGTHIDSNYLCVFVRDNGSGMDSECLESLFDPFYTSKKNGVGLGLTSTQTIISEHQGQIEVDSSLGHGSHFTIFLPLD